MRKNSPTAPSRSYEAVHEQSRITSFPIRICTIGVMRCTAISAVGYGRSQIKRFKRDSANSGEALSRGYSSTRSLVGTGLTKDRLLEYLGASALANSAMELYQQQELDRLIGHFFDRAVCYTAGGYERQASEKKTSGEDGELRR